MKEIRKSRGVQNEELQLSHNISEMHARHLQEKARGRG